MSLGDDDRKQDNSKYLEIRKLTASVVVQQMKLDYPSCTLEDVVATMLKPLAVRSSTKDEDVRKFVQSAWDLKENNDAEETKYEKIERLKNTRNRLAKLFE